MESKGYTQDGTVDLRGRPFLALKTGKWKTCAFLVGYEAFERMAFYGISSNLVVYLTKQLHEDTVSSVRNVNNWSGAVWITPIIGAWIADSYLGRFWTFTVSSILYVIEIMLVPPWLERLLASSFFNVCRTHGDAARSECNMFCLDCNVDAFCFYCRSSKHKDHQVIQIRRSSYHDVVRVSEVQRVLDISGVQTYVINSARVMFLNERPQPKGGKTVSHICEICGRSLLDTFRFCSLGCKLVGIKSNGDASFILDGKNEMEGISRREEEELREGSQQDICPPTPPPPPSNSRRRKGIPKRAPFRS